ncbi:hypothetical protein TALC_01089 [Thermoplasmatales archaeon BRNA1]|nr:hypothetical protein TALC_01089 [Thermoplasmatales archaeon BRNA1]
MTRLTPAMIDGLSDELSALDKYLIGATGMDIRTLGFRAIGVDPTKVDITKYKAASVPITSGLGVIGGFSKSVADIVRDMGMECFVTERTDVWGFGEAIDRGADIILMADDEQYMAYSVAAGKYSNNSYCTAAGYVEALRGAADGLEGKDVFVRGAGRVGSNMVALLRAAGARVTVGDVIKEKAEAVAKANPGTCVADDIDEATYAAHLLLNASPSPIPGQYVREGAIISTPGIPHVYDEETLKKAKFIHDPLAIGTAPMVAQAIAFSLPEDCFLRKEE